MSDYLIKEVSDLKLTVQANATQMASKFNELANALNELNRGVSAKLKPLEDDLAARTKAEAEAADKVKADELAALKQQIEALKAERDALKTSKIVAAAAADVAKK